MRLVLDTNAAISGLLWHGNPGKIVDAAYAALVTLHTSAPLLAELRDVILREKFAKALAVRGLSATEVFEGYAALATVVIPATIPPTVIEDPDDDAVLACAVSKEPRQELRGEEREPAAEDDAADLSLGPALAEHEHQTADHDRDERE